MLASESVGIDMVPGATATVSHKVWEELVPSKTSALDAWRFEPSSMLEQNNSTADAWISHASRRDMQSLTLALQRELCATNNNNNNNFYNIESSLPQWKCKSESDVSSGSEAGGSRGGGRGYAIESPCRQQPDVQNNQNNALGMKGKVSKRRSRAANKTPITFLNADPANFRAMVQQVTGVPLNPNATRLWSAAGVAVPGLVKPEPKRPSTPVALGGGGGGGNYSAIQGLPTLDTSALFIASYASASAPRGGTSSSYTFSPPPPLIRAAATPPLNEELLITEKLKAALIKNGGGGGGGGSGGFFVVDQGQGMMNFAQEADSWFNNNPDVELGGSILL